MPQTQTTSVSSNVSHPEALASASIDRTEKSASGSRSKERQKQVKKVVDEVRKLYKKPAPVSKSAQTPAELPTSAQQQEKIQSPALEQELKTEPTPIAAPVTAKVQEQVQLPETTQAPISEPAPAQAEAAQTIVDIEQVKINNAIYPRKRKQGDKEWIEKYKKIQLGNHAPLLLSRSSNPDNDNVLIDGHMTLEALKELGIKQVRVIYQDVTSLEDIFQIAVERNCFHGKHLTREEKIQATRRFYDAGRTQAQIAAILYVDQSTVSLWLKRTDQTPEPAVREPSENMKIHIDNVTPVCEAAKVLTSTLRKSMSPKSEVTPESLDAVLAQLVEFQSQINEFSGKVISLRAAVAAKLADAATTTGVIADTAYEGATIDVAADANTPSADQTTDVGHPDSNADNAVDAVAPVVIANIAAVTDTIPSDDADIPTTDTAGAPTSSTPTVNEGSKANKALPLAAATATVMAVGSVPPVAFAAASASEGMPGMSAIPVAVLINGTAVNTVATAEAFTPAACNSPTAVAPRGRRKVIKHE
ncbi:MAG: hypothetical protein HQM09_24815 [Candidatus Riflebacteria bacterium]|nr:hypothetical protein [Candidatus Riflebacteria bacterium]